MRHDNLILAVGVIRCLVWITGTVAAFKFKRWMVGAGFALSSANSIAFSFFNAHYHVPHSLIQIVNYESTLAVALIVAGFVFGTIAYSSHKAWTP